MCNIIVYCYSVLCALSKKVMISNVNQKPGGKTKFVAKAKLAKVKSTCHFNGKLPAAQTNKSHDQCAPMKGDGAEQTKKEIMCQTAQEILHEKSCRSKFPSTEFERAKRPPGRNGFASNCANELPERNKFPPNGK